MKKLWLLPISLCMLASCTLPGSDSSFSSLYQKNIHSQVESFDTLGKAMGLDRHESMIGSLKSSVNVPEMLSGSVSAEFTGLVSGRDSDVFFRNVQAMFTSLMGSGSLSAEEVGVKSHRADTYISYKNITDNGIIPASLKAVLQKYQGTWFDMNSVANYSTEERMIYTVMSNIFKTSLADVEKYATEYPIFKEIGDLGMSGSLHVWNVDIDRGNVASLVKKLYQDFSGTGMDTESIKNMEEGLKGLSFSGKLGFDPANPKVSLLDGSFSVSGALVATVVFAHNEDTSSIKIQNPENQGDIVILYGKNKDKYTLDATVSQENIEMGKVTGYVEVIKGKFHELSLDASAQGITVSLKHTLEVDKFMGKLSSIVGTIEWSGTLSNEKLTGFKLDGTTPMGTVSANLVSSGSDGMIRGPVVVKTTDTVIASANLALEIAKEKFAIIVDLASESLPAHFELSISGKSTPSTQEVTLPKDIKPLEDLMKEINALEDPIESEYPSNTSTGNQTQTGMNSIAPVLK